MAASFLGSWKLTESEKFDDFLKELGVSEYLLIDKMNICCVFRLDLEMTHQIAFHPSEFIIEF